MSPSESLRLHLMADFNIELLGRYLSNSAESPEVTVEVAPFGQVMPVLARADSDEGVTGLVWTRPEGVAASYGRALGGEPVAEGEVLSEVDAFADLLLRYASQRRRVLVNAWSLPETHWGYGVLDWRPGLGLSALLARMNLRLAERVASAGNIYLVDLLRGVQASGAPLRSAKLYYVTKVPYSNAVLQQVARELKAALLCLEGRGRRLIVLDLDDTLWGGVVGETGWEGVRLGGHDHVGEAFLDFQRALVALTRRGVQLAVVSKNDESVALEAIDQHPEMQLRRSDLAGWRINWTDKAANIVALAEEIGLGLSSLVFIDDNPAERGRVREALPEVLVPEWPADPSAYAETLTAMRCFDVASLTAEDRARKRMYVAERERRESRMEGGSLEDWLMGLEIRVEQEPLSPQTLPRVAQLFNKTNQLNMATRRLTAAEIESWSAEPGRVLHAVRVADRFGDLGLTGIVTVEQTGERAVMRDFLLSCRAMGRRVEETLLHLAVASARQSGARELAATYVPTPRNPPCLRALRASGFTEPEPHTFVWSCSEPFPLPACVTLGAAPSAPRS